MDERTLLIEAAQQIGVTLSGGMADRFMDYKALLKAWNEKMNLTAITDDREIILKHFIDSLSVLPFLEAGGSARIADIGAGAGFPSLPLKIAVPSLQMTLIDSLNKRLVFLDEVIAKLGLTGVTLLHARAEDVAKRPDLRERFDAVTARAVSRMPVLAEYCLPFVKPGGRFLAMKGSDIGAELEESKKAIEALGGRIEAVEEVAIPFTDIRHSIIITKKYRQTPPQFPRKAAQIAKGPIK